MLNTLSILKKKPSGEALIFTTMNPHDDVFHRPGQGLYIFVPLSWYEHNITKNGRKAGQYGSNTIGGKLPQETILEYSGTTTEPFVILFAIRLTDEQISKYGSAYNIEQTLMKNWRRSTRGGKSTEVYDTPLDTIIGDIKNYLYPSSDPFLTHCKNIYRPRLRQEEAIKKFCKWAKKRIRKGRSINKFEINFLLDAVPRFGKNFTVLQMVLGVVPKGACVLVITNRPDTFDTLDDDISNHIDFEVMSYSEFKDVKDGWVPSKDKINVLAVSTQLLNNSNNKQLLKFLMKFDWCLKFVDEADTGMLTELSADIRNKLPSKYTIWASGTSDKLHSTGMFTRDNTYRYDYLQQQEDKKNGIASLDAVSLVSYILSFPKSILEKAQYYSEAEGFNFAKFLKFNPSTGTFVHEVDVINWLKHVLNKMPRVLKGYSPYKEVPNLDHTLWALPRDSKAVIRMKQLIENIAGDEYKVFAATANETTDIVEIKDYMKKYPDKKTITLTLGRFNRGTTVPKWNGVFMMCDSEALEYYIQTIFRGTTPALGKEFCYVFDFLPSRILSMWINYCRSASRHAGSTNPAQYYRKLLDVMNIYHLPDGEIEWKSTTIDHIFYEIRNSLATSTSDELRRTAYGYTNADVVSKMPKDFHNMLAEIDLDKNSKKMRQKFIAHKSQYVTKGKTYEQTSNNKIQNQEELYKKLMIDTIATMMSRLPLLTHLGPDTIEDIIREIPDEIFYGATECPKRILEWLVEYVDENSKPAINVYDINLLLKLS